MKNIIKLEELFLFALSIFLFAQLDYAWWWYLVLLLAPDIGAVGYLVSPALGSVTYNLVHHKGVAILGYVAGAFVGNPLLQLAGLIMLGHSSVDRAFGYGLKYPDSFKHTHLGKIGNATKKDVK